MCRAMGYLAFDLCNINLLYKQVLRLVISYSTLGDAPNKKCGYNTKFSIKALTDDYLYNVLARRHPVPPGKEHMY